MLNKAYLCCVVAVTSMGSASSVRSHEWHRHGTTRDSALPTDPTKTTKVGNSPVKASQSLAKLPESGSRSLIKLVSFNPQQKSLGLSPQIAQYFMHFKNVKVRWDASTLYVESNGLPEHNMMEGIRSWQQQVPLPQPFTGSNSWKIPLNPKLASRPINARQTSFRGAIAVAVNGVPIFSALNNRGDDAYLAGELDKWGGHCGRGDDYHYHIAPLHLEEKVGKGNPIAFALDGFPIYGLTEADGSPVGKLDELNGQFDSNGNYHYHATKKYPYINGGVRGVVEFRNGEIASQPRDQPIRPALQPLRGATITDFHESNGISKLTYKIGGRSGSVAYEQVGTDRFKFTYQEPNGRSYSETYQRQNRPGNRPNSDRQRPPPRRR